MKKIRVLTVSFSSEIRSYEIPAFRAAIIEKAGRENIIFHNHLGKDQYLFRYPLIQYKCLLGKPSIMCIDEGVDEIHKFFEKSNWDIRIGDRFLEMKIHQLSLNQFTMQVLDTKYRYSISKWIALNQDNFKKYQQLEGLVAKTQFLEKTLVGNILSMAKGIGWNVDKQVELDIVGVDDYRPAKIKSRTLMGFDVEFSTNVFLPNNIGLGKGVSLGYGLVRKKKFIS